MTSEFSVITEEMWLVDEDAFHALGGDELHFSVLDSRSCRLRVTGSIDAVRAIAFGIRCHHTSAA